jgi:nitroreductase
MDFLEKLRWRYATKKMDPAKRVDDAVVERIIEATRLTPTSSGLQPFHLALVTNQALKAKLVPACWGQAQLADSSHVLIFAAWDTYTADRINAAFDLHAQVRGGTNDGWEDYRKRLLGTYPARSAEENFQHAARQAYIGLGFALAAAAIEDVDATPMEGFDPVQVDEVLGLREKGLRSVVVLPLGVRDEANDWLVKQKKVRRPRESFVLEYR